MLSEYALFTEGQLLLKTKEDGHLVLMVLLYHTVLHPPSRLEHSTKRSPGRPLFSTLNLAIVSMSYPRGNCYVRFV